MVTAQQYAAGTGTPWATDVAMQVLRQGGNAFDAAAAALLALNVTHDEASSFPGIAPLMLYDASSNRVLSYIGAGTAPQAATIERFKSKGYKTVPDLNIWPFKITFQTTPFHKESPWIKKPSILFFSSSPRHPKTIFQLKSPRTHGWY